MEICEKKVSAGLMAARRRKQRFTAPSKQESDLPRVMFNKVPTVVVGRAPVFSLHQKRLWCQS